MSKTNFLYNRRGSPRFYENSEQKAEMLTSGNFKDPNPDDKPVYNPLFDEGPDVKIQPPPKPVAPKIVSKINKNLQFEEV